MELDPELVERMGFNEDELNSHPRKHFRTLEFTVGHSASLTYTPEQTDENKSIRLFKVYTIVFTIEAIV